MWPELRTWLQGEAKRTWPYVLLAFLVALTIITAWFLYHVWWGRLS